MKKTVLSDDALDRLLSRYRVAVDTGDGAIDALVRAARLRAVEMRQGIEAQGFFGAVAGSLGFHRLSAAAWSGGIAAMLALAIGLSLGATNIVPRVDSEAVALDLDTVTGAGALATGSAMTRADDEAL